MGLRVTTPSGIAPFAVTSNARNPLLNADLVDGYHASWLTRAAQGLGAGPESTISAIGGHPYAEATLLAPASGYVMVTGSSGVDVMVDSCNTPCSARMQLHDVSADAYSYPISTSIPGTSSDSLSQTWIFPVSPGRRTFELMGSVTSHDGADVDLRTPVIAAVFLPFGWAGGGSPLVPPPSR